MDSDPVVTVETPGGRIALGRDELGRVADPEAAARAGEWATGLTAVAFRALIGLVDPRPSADVTHATFHAADGYAASIPLEQALDDGIVLVPPAEAGRVGVRLLVSRGHTTCLNVKAVGRIELTAGPGKHTVDPNPHTAAFVPGWDD